MSRTLFANKERFFDAYYKPFPGIFFKVDFSQCLMESYFAFITYFMLNISVVLKIFCFKMYNKMGNILGYYFTGDGAMRDSDGHYHITGRVDDVINIKGIRLGTAEVEDTLVSILVIFLFTILIH